MESGGKNPKVDTGKMKANFPFDLGSDGISLLLLQYIFLRAGTTQQQQREGKREEARSSLKFLYQKSKRYRMLTVLSVWQNAESTRSCIKHRV